MSTTGCVYPLRPLSATLAKAMAINNCEVRTVSNTLYASPLLD